MFALLWPRETGILGGIVHVGFRMRTGNIRVVGLYSDVFLCPGRQRGGGVLEPCDTVTARFIKLTQGSGQVYHLVHPRAPRAR